MAITERQREIGRAFRTRHRDRLRLEARERSRLYYRNNTEQAKANRRNYRRTHPERVSAAARKSKLKQLFGLTPSAYDAMVIAQGGACAICRNHETVKVNGTIVPLAVDHCHSSGEVRGLLCIRCNRGIGMFRDNPEILFGAVNYLRGSHGVQDSD